MEADSELPEGPKVHSGWNTWQGWAGTSDMDGLKQPSMRSGPG
jgi:hypothetical protein